MSITIATTKAVSFSRFLSSSGAHRLLSAAEEVELAQLVAQGSQTAKDIFINSNIRWVVSIALRHQGRGLELEDLIQEGTIGLIVAVERFDWTLGNRFSTFATWWIRQTITRAIENNGRMIRLPALLLYQITSLKVAQNNFAITHGREATNTELAALLELSPDKITALKDHATNLPMSLDAQYEFGESTSIGMIDKIARTDSHELEIIDVEAQADVRQKINNMLSLLDPRSRNVIMLRFGFDGHEPITLEETGTMLNLTNSRIGQIESAALEKLRARLDISEFTMFLEMLTPSVGSSGPPIIPTNNSAIKLSPKRVLVRKNPRNPIAPHQSANLTKLMLQVLEALSASGGIIETEPGHLSRIIASVITNKDTNASGLLLKMENLGYIKRETRNGVRGPGARPFRMILMPSGEKLLHAAAEFKDESTQVETSQVLLAQTIISEVAKPVSIKATVTDPLEKVAISWGLVTREMAFRELGINSDDETAFTMLKRNGLRPKRKFNTTLLYDFSELQAAYRAMRTVEAIGNSSQITV